MASRVIGVPDENGRHSAVHPNSHEAGHAEADRRGRDVCNDGVAYNGNGQDTEYNRAADAHLIR